MLKKILSYFSYLKPVWFKFFLGISFGIVYSIASGLGLPVMVEKVFPILFGNISEAPAWLISIADTYFEGKVDGGFLLICCLAIPRLRPRSQGLPCHNDHKTPPPPPPRPAGLEWRPPRRAAIRPLPVFLPSAGGPQPPFFFQCLGKR